MGRNTKYKKEYGKKITNNQYDKLLQFFILSLYTDIPPRRNMDYQSCYIIKKYNDKLPNDTNYYSIDDKEFIFNVYKTASKYGQQKIIIKDNKEMLNAMKLYLKYHPLVPKRYGKTSMIRLLVYYDGSPLNQNNSITRILNKIFKKKIGASMLRHIYLTSKYSNELEEMKQDAQQMGHSLEKQKEYIINDEV